MQKVISILGVIASVLFATAPQFSTIQPKTAAWLTLIGTVATAASGALARFGASNIYITVVGVVVAVTGVIAGASDLIPQNITFIMTVIGTAVAAFGKSLFNIGESDENGGSSLPSILILGSVLTLAGATSACDKTNEYAKTLDRIAGYVGTGLDLVEYQVDNGQISKDNAIAITSALKGINEINGQLIAESKKYLSADGKTLVLDAEGKGKLLASIAASRNVAVGILTNPAITSLSPDKRDKYALIIGEITTTIDILAELVNTVKLKEVK